MKFCILGSGSKGNSTYVESDGGAVLIDAGFSGVEIERRLATIGVEPDNLDAILVTHEHGDHINGVGVLSRRFGLPVFANVETRKAAGKHLDNLNGFQEFVTGTAFQVKDITVHPFSINHDTADPVGFTISDSCASFGYCTDTGMVSHLIHHHLSGCNGLVLECNHDLEMLRHGHYPPSLQQRIRSKNGHLANPEAVKLLKELAYTGLEHVVLAHISESNNSYDIVRRSAESLLAELRFENGGRDPGLKITIASQAEVGKLVEIGDCNRVAPKKR